MRQVRAIVFLAIALIGWFSVVGAVESTTPGRVNAEHVNVRSGPDLSDRVIGTLKQGEIVQVLGQKGTWLEIQYPDGCYMWTSTKLIKVDEPADNNWGEGVKGSIGGSRVRIRVSPDLKAAIIREAEFKEPVTVLGKKGDWYFLKPDANLKAYISASLVNLEKVEAPPAKHEQEASVSKPAPAVATKPVLSVPVRNDLPTVTPVVEEAHKISPVQQRADAMIQQSGATADGVVEKVPPATEAQTGCGFRLLVGGIPVNYLRSATANLDKYVGLRVTVHGSKGAKATGRDQQIINVDFVEEVKE